MQIKKIFFQKNTNFLNKLKSKILKKKFFEKK